MGIFKKIFGATDLLKGAAKIADELHYSPEEKASHYLSVMNMYTAYKIAQRYLALIFSIPYAFLWFIVGLLSLIPDYDTAPTLAVLNSTRVGDIVWTIIAFYFLGGVAEGIVGKFKKS